MGTGKASCNPDGRGNRQKFGRQIGTLARVLAEAGIELSEYDIVTPSLDDELGEENLSINVQKAFQLTLD